MAACFGWLPRQLDIDRPGDDGLTRDRQDLIDECLGYLTPFPAILKALGKNVVIRFA